VVQDEGFVKPSSSQELGASFRPDKFGPSTLSRKLAVYPGRKNLRPPFTVVHLRLAALPISSVPLDACLSGDCSESRAVLANYPAIAGPSRNLPAGAIPAHAGS
jgi:hypothetical protein